jgi:hypothetical protein
MRNEHDDVAALVGRLEREPSLPEGQEERFAGYGVMAVPFQSGDILAMRRFAASSLGHGYSSVWHRAPEGTWTFWSDQPPLEACPRYFGSAISRAVMTPIVIRWPKPRQLEVEVPAAELRWTLELETTRSTRTMNRLGEMMPDRLWRSPRALALMAKLAGRLLHAGRLGLSGHLPNGQAFVANPMLVWSIRESSAAIGGRDLGPVGALPEQAHLGDFWLPQRALFAVGRAFFEPADQSRHHLVAQLEDLLPAH